MNNKDYIKTRTFSKSRSIKSTAKLEPMRVVTTDKSINFRSVKINLPARPILTRTWASKHFNVVSGIAEAF